MVSPELAELPRTAASTRAGHQARGFVLVELLIVIAIIGILVSGLLPAVQSWREAERPSKSEIYGSSRIDLPLDSPVSGQTGVGDSAGGASAAFVAFQSGNTRTGQMTNWANHGLEPFALASQTLVVFDPIGPITEPATVGVSADLSGPTSGGPIVDFTQSAAGSTASIHISTALNGQGSDEWGFTVELDGATDRLEIIEEIGEFDPSDITIEGKEITGIDPFSDFIDLPAGEPNEITFSVSTSVLDVVPEPGTMGLLALGACLALLRRRR